MMFTFLSFVFVALFSSADIKIQSIAGASNITIKNNELHIEVSASSSELSFSFLSTSKVGIPSLNYSTSEISIVSPLVMLSTPFTKVTNQNVSLAISPKDICANETTCVNAGHFVSYNFQLGLDGDSDGLLWGADDDVVNISIDILK